MHSIIWSVVSVVALGCGGTAASGEQPGPARHTPAADEPADAVPAESAPVSAEEEEVEGEEGGVSEEEVKACQEQFKELSEMAQSQHSPEKLMGVALCFKNSGMPGMQLRLLSMIEQRFPRSKEAKRALRASGEAYEEIGFLQRAAEAYERYGRKYGREDDAPAVLERAVCLQHALDLPSAERNARLLAQLRRKGRAKSGAKPAELCPDAIELLTGAICRLHAHERSETDQMAESLAKHRADRFERDYAAPADLCSER